MPLIYLALAHAYLLGLGLTANNHPAMIVSLLGCVFAIVAYGVVPREDDK